MISTPPAVHEMTLYFTEITGKAKYLLKVMKIIHCSAKPREINHKHTDLLRFYQY